MSWLTEWRSIPCGLPHKITSYSAFLFVSVLLLSGVKIAPAQNQDDVRTLDSFEPLKRELAGGQIHQYQVVLSANQFLQVVVDQRGIDAVVAVFGPDGKKLLEADSLLGQEGPEQFSIVAGVAGTYRIEVSSLDNKAPAGSYQIKIEALRPVTPQDSIRVDAEKQLLEATVLIAQGAAGSSQKAIPIFEKALVLFQSLDDQVGQARVLSSLGEIYRLLDEQQKELDCFQRALPKWEATGYRYIAGYTLDRLGLVYSYIGEMQKSIDSFAGERDHWRAVAETMKEASALNNMAIIYWAIGENQKALGYYAEVLQIVESTANAQGQAATLNNIGKVYDDLGEKQKALEAYNKSLEFSKLANDRKTQGITLRHIGSLYLSLGEPQKALDKFMKALPLHEGSKDNLGKALTLNKIGMVYNSDGDTQKALDYYNQALTLIRSVKNINARGEGYILNNIGEIYSSRHEYQKAFEYYNQALQFFQKSVHPQGEAERLNNIGQVYINLRDEQKALDYLSKALSINRAIGHKSEEAYSHYLIAQAERNRGNLDESLNSIDAALETVETLRGRIDADDLRQSYFGSVQDYYNFKIDLLMQLDKLSASKQYAALAFQTSERARARTLLERLVEAQVDIRQGVDPVLLQRQQALQESINALASGRQPDWLKGKQRPERAAFAAREIEKLTSAYQELKAQIRASSPRYAALTQPQPLTLSEIQQQVLDPDTMLLEYSLGDEQSYLWAVTQSSIASFTLPKRAEVEAAARRVYELLTARNRRESGETIEQRRARMTQAEAQYPEAAAALSRVVLSPVASMLMKKRLLIVCEGALQYVPFAALPAPDGARESADSQNREPATGYLPLIVDHEIVNLLSASALAVLRRETAGRRPADKAVAVLADPVFDKRDQRCTGRTKTERVTTVSAAIGNAFQQDNVERNVRDVGLADDEGHINRLPFSRREAKAILSVVAPGKGIMALDFKASRATATSDELRQYRIVHFATHGVLDSQRPELSGVIFSLVDEQCEAQDGFLRLHDIYNLNLPVEMVVLSACQTGLGKEIRGEGLVGLTRGFMYAGAARVVASLWQVDDAATAELMGRFYKGMMRGRLRPTAALKAAQVEMWKQWRWRAPYCWAAFVLQGEWK